MLLFHPDTEHMRFLNICLQERRNKKAKALLAASSSSLVSALGWGLFTFQFAPLSSVDGRSCAPHEHLLDVVQTAGVGFEDGRVMEHLIESDAQEDYVELKDTATPTLG